jgi:hypothetical protein
MSCKAGCIITVRVRRILYILVALCIMALCFGAFWTHARSIPPSDATLVKHFYDHRDDFEKLRAMLEKDSSIREVATYGVSTTNRNEIDPLTPDQAGLQKGRYEEYLTTLKLAGAGLAVHFDDGEFYFLVKRWGFAGEGWGIAVVSRDAVPKNQVSSLDDFSKTSWPRDGAYRHVQDNWYLWMK